ncbi:MAG: CotH kinase family protein [Saprospiraceae bacterium]|nr:CotH kinase family protein [Saprospiraceae bacterium]
MMNFNFLAICVFMVSFSINHLHGQDLYDTDSIQEMHITFSQSNWDYLLDSLMNIGDDRLMAQSVVLNGVSFDSAGVRFKGNSSYQPNNIKNPLNVKLSYLKDQDYNGYQTFKLSSGFKDPSFAREVYAYEIARNYMPAPRANFINVYINGSLYGLFTNVEAVNKDFLENYFSSNENILFKCDGDFSGPPTPIPGCPPGHGSSLEYKGQDSSCYFSSYEMKRSFGWNQLVNTCDILNNQSSNVHNVIYVDRALWMLAFNNLIVNFDSYSGSRHNYYIYHDKSDRFHTILWDLNEAFGCFGQSGFGPSMSINDMKNLDPLHNINSFQHPLIQKLLANPEYKKTYIAHLRTIYDEHFANGTYSVRLNEIKSLVDASVQADMNKKYSYQDFVNNYNMNIGNMPGLNDFISGRTIYLNGNFEMNQVPPSIAYPVESPNSVEPNDTVWITSAISNATSVKLRYREGQYDIFLEKDMLDDGNYQDGSAGDGTYGAFLIVPATGLQYYIYSENNDAAMLSPERAEYEFYSISTSSGLLPSSLVINEFMASNSSTVADQDGEFDDWVELYNNTSSPINLLGLYLSDNFSSPTKWAFPDTSIAANGYLMIWIDDDMSQTGLHTGFKLSSSGEEIAIFDNTGNFLDSVSYDAQITDMTTGRYPNGIGPFISMTPTFQAVNVNNTAVTTLSSINNWFVYPNPLHDQALSVRLKMAKGTKLRCSVSNALGQQVWEQIYVFNAGVNTINIPNLEWYPGIYTISIHDGFTVESKRVIKL